LETRLLEQRADELAELRAAHRFTLWVASSLAVVGLVAVITLVLLLWRLLARRPGTALAYVGSPGATGAAGVETGLMLVNPVEQANARFLNALEQLEKRIREMEAGTPVTPVSPLDVSAPGPDTGAETRRRQPAPAPETEPRPAPANDDPAADRVDPLLSKGQSLMDAGRLDAALGCFTEALALDQANPEAHLKTASALEKLDRFDEALREYDAALARDSTLTMAYLGKGSVFNRLERHSEALRCYEQALRTQHHAGVVQ
ncbi:tetratricopeptide repeat protein, partial [bacterium]|nr:tetratricopeptide repeat protein [bacterium]